MCRGAEWGFSEVVPVPHCLCGISGAYLPVWGLCSVGVFLPCFEYLCEVEVQETLTLTHCCLTTFCPWNLKIKRELFLKAIRISRWQKCFDDERAEENEIY